MTGLTTTTAPTSFLCLIPQKPDGAGCDRKLEALFGGPGAVVGSDRDPLTVGTNPQAVRAGETGGNAYRRFRV